MKNKLKIESSFNRASHTYNDNAILQKQVAHNLAEFAHDDILKAKRIIDLGCATGFVAEEVFKIVPDFPHKKMVQLDISEEMMRHNPHPTHKIICDIEKLPFPADFFDLALSSLTFQWINDLKTTIPQILKTLSKGGKLYFSTVGEKTLQELKTACANCQIDLGINEFVNEESLKTILADFNFTLEKKELMLQYQDCFDLLKSMKKIGANHSEKKKLLNRTKFEELNDFYLKNFKTSGKVFATWQIFYISVQK